jgi:tRNA nucleotidyltransferase (CCA-adding enzyme)
MKQIGAKINELAKIVERHGGRAMLVGGCVRDALMGIEPKDWDLEIYGIEPQNLEKF